MTISKNDSGFVFNFAKIVPAESNGKIMFYRPDQKKYDCEFELNVDTLHQQILPYKSFKEGYYDLQVEWTSGDKTFLFEDKISF